MITPIILIGYIACGAASAFGGWLFHRIMVVRGQVNDLEARIQVLEK
jgi:hypothetical protein